MKVTSIFCAALAACSTAAAAPTAPLFLPASNEPLSAQERQRFDFFCKDDSGIVPVALVRLNPAALKATSVSVEIDGKREVFNRSYDALSRGAGSWMGNSIPRERLLMFGATHASVTLKPFQHFTTRPLGDRYLVARFEPSPGPMCEVGESPESIRKMRTQAAAARPAFIAATRERCAAFLKTVSNSSPKPR